METPEPNPCPFCGGDAELRWTQCPQTIDEFEDTAAYRRYYVECDVCGATTRLCGCYHPDLFKGAEGVEPLDEWNNEAAQKAVRLWNLRAK